MIETAVFGYSGCTPNIKAPHPPFDGVACTLPQEWWAKTMGPPDALEGRLGLCRAPTKMQPVPSGPNVPNMNTGLLSWRQGSS